MARPRRVKIARLLTAAALAGWMDVALLRAQAPPPDAPPRPEFRADLLGPAPFSPQLGLGVNIDAGYYSRIEVVGAAGTLRRGDVLTGTGRVDAILRLMLDPFAESRWGVSLGGGASARYEPGDRVRPYLVALLDLEGPPVGRYRVAWQLGVGGGVRAGIAVRRMREMWR